MFAVSSCEVTQTELSGEDIIDSEAPAALVRASLSPSERLTNRTGAETHVLSGLVPTKCVKSGSTAARVCEATQRSLGVIPKHVYMPVS